MTHDLNTALCDALGITDTRHIAAVDLRLRPGQRPVVTVTRVLQGADTAADLQRVVSQFELHMQPRQLPQER